MVDKLAINGGEKTINESLPIWPQFDMKVVKDIERMLDEGKVNYWTGDATIIKGIKEDGDFGSVGMEFEKRYAKYHGAKYCISTSNGTTALHTALAAFDIGPGDEVIVPSYTFIASSFSICQAGAIPVFADVEKHSHCIDPEDIKRKITDRTKAILPVHLYGNVADMDAIMAIAKEHDLYVIEDCAQAHGATYKGKMVGTFGNAGCFSFCQSKTFTTGGEGGAVITDDEDAIWNMRSFRDHGYDVRERIRLLELEAKLPYIHNTVGFNYRLTELQSAIGIRELERLANWNLPRRRKNGQILIDMLKDIPEVTYLPIHDEENLNGFFVFPIVLDIDNLNCDIREFIDALDAEGAPAGPVFWPQSYKESAYVNKNGFGKLNYPFGDPNNTDIDYTKVFCENAAWLEDRTFITNLHPTLEEEHMELIGRAIIKVVEGYRK
ncbi:MAG: DegT/DnrJ/EryC1/StrS family aminotransferase [Clostridiales bacterium]|nr:DegT/DnrJ/EryC1/StrS family aminotransferase [Clostridiales bacterium]